MAVEILAQTDIDETGTTVLMRLIAGSMPSVQVLVDRDKVTDRRIRWEECVFNMNLPFGRAGYCDLDKCIALAQECYDAAVLAAGTSGDAALNTIANWPYGVRQ